MKRTPTPMRHFFRVVGGAAVAAGLIGWHIASVSSDQAPPVNVAGINKPVIVVSGEVTGSETWTSGYYYVLRGAVFVREGATLSIQAGTTVIGESGTRGTLVVERGGRLNAIGTREQPIVFTSDQAVGSRGRGDWGGLIINGRAPINFGGGVGTVKVTPGCTAAPIRTTTAERYVMCESSSPVSSSALITS